MSDVTIKRIEDFDSPNSGGFCRARATLGVSAFFPAPRRSMSAPANTGSSRASSPASAPASGAR